MSKDVSYRHILKYTGLFGGIQAINLLASVLRNKVAAIIIDRYGQGISELFNSTINLISSATTLIIPVSIVRRISFVYENYGLESTLIRNEIRAIRSWSVLTGLIGTLLVMILSPVLSSVTCDSKNFTFDYLILSPMLIMLSINGTEIAILKAVRQLKKLIKASLAGSISTLAICCLCYYFWNTKGVAISLDVSLCIVTLLNLRYTIKIFPYKAKPFCWRILSHGKSLIKLSISFLLASVVAALSETIIRTYISQSGSIENVGLYAAGFALTVTYTRFIFNAMDADYYPHLSGICHDPTLMNSAINKQINVCVQLIVPCLLLFVLFLPQIISILYTSKYLEIVPMVICATFYMFSKAIITPIAYIALAKADSKMYLIIESISAILLGICVIAGYENYSLMGCGIGLSVSNVIEAIIIIMAYKKYYGVNISKNTFLIIIAQLVLLAIGLCIIAFCNITTIKVLAVSIMAVSSIAISIHTLRKNN